MERDSQVDGQAFIRQPTDTGHQSDGREGDPARPEVVAVWVIQRLDGLPGCLIVRQRLTHAHEHDVGHGVTLQVGIDAQRVRPLDLGLLDLPGEIQNLSYDLASGQVPSQAVLSGRAEETADPTPHLGRDAGGPALIVLHQYALDDIAVAQAKEHLARLAGERLLFRHGLEHLQVGLCIQPLSQWQWQIAHRGEITSQRPVQPAPELIRTETGLAPACKQGLHLRMGKVVEGNSLRHPAPPPTRHEGAPHHRTPGPVAAPSQTGWPHR